MADTANSIKSSALILSISTNLDTPAYSSVVCMLSAELSGSRDVTTVSTWCGSSKAGGTPNWTFSGELVLNTDPDPDDELSSAQLIALFESGDNFLWKLAHATTPADYFRSGTGFLSSYSESAPEDDTIRSSFTVEVIGAVDATSA